MHHAWVAAYVTSTLYTYAWDVRIDWRLGNLQHGGLADLLPHDAEETQALVPHGLLRVAPRRVEATLAPCH